MDDKITLDKETFKALAIDSRVNILKKLDERFQLTLSDLAEELSMAPSTIKEHLDKLVAAELIVQLDRGQKWKYYRLSPKGKKILNPYEKRVWIVLSASLLVLFGALYSLISRMQDLIVGVPLAAPAALDDGANALSQEADYASKQMLEAAHTTTTTFHRVAEEAGGVLQTTTLPAIEATQQIPYFELFLVVFLVLVVGICVGYLIRKKRIL